MGRYPALFDGTGGEVAEAGDAVAAAGAAGARAGPGLVQPHVAPEPGVRGRNAGGELQEVVAGRARGWSRKSHWGRRAYRAFTAASISTGASSVATKSLPGLVVESDDGAFVEDLGRGASVERSASSVRLMPRILAARSIAASRLPDVRKFTQPHDEFNAGVEAGHPDESRIVGTGCGKAARTEPGAGRNCGKGGKRRTQQDCALSWCVPLTTALGRQRTARMVPCPDERWHVQGRRDRDRGFPRGLCSTDSRLRPASCS